MNNNEQPIGTGVVVLDAEKRILLGKRKNSYKSGYYGMPGGRVEVGEPTQDAAKRELKEEAGLNGNTFIYLGVVREWQGAYDFIHFGYMCEDYTGDVTLMEPDKCEQWEWFSVDALPEQILPGHKATIDLYNQYLTTQSSHLIDISK